MKDYYIFPAILKYGADGVSVSFPDIPECQSRARDIAAALTLAQTALGLYLFDLEKENKQIPTPSDIHKIKLEAGNIPILIDIFMPPFREQSGE